MVYLTETILKSGLANRLLSPSQVSRLIGGSDARRYGQINRALRAGELIKARRGLYLLNPIYVNQQALPLHPFVVAQQLSPGSYVSAESALAFHGWIPESVHTVLSMTLGGKAMTYEQEQLGRFEYRRMTTKPGYFLQLVSRQELMQQAALVAEPLRALIDLVYLRKFNWQGIDFLAGHLRIDEQALQKIVLTDITKLTAVYKGKREQAFLEKLQSALSL